ncbi:unnamed protein product [Urochloa decumbens]|uniref:Dirigent protein n=1 Tax=Urochloa decumbens TaxID=240449 RepID=A0ABC8ZR81_9POAL
MMASSAANRLLLLLAAAMALTTLLAPSVSAWRRPMLARRRLMRVKVYVQEYLGNGPETTEKVLVRGPGPVNPSLYPPNNLFGDTLVMDNLATKSIDNTSAPVGRLYGTYMVSSMSHPVHVVSFTLLLTTRPYNGSTIVMGGIDDSAPVLEHALEHAVIGGTGAFRGAQGHVIGKLVKVYSPTHVVMELDVYASVPVLWTQAEEVPASPLIVDH